MPDESFEFDVLRDLLAEAGAVAQLAKGEKGFTTTYEAFRAGDRKAFQTALKRLRLAPRCELVCEWLRVKECLFLCLELCGPPKVVERPDPRVLAEAIVRITSDEKLVTQLAAAIEKRDRAAFQRIVKAQKLEPICHLLCHWVCYVHYRLVCRWVCDLGLKERPSLVAELQASGHALRALLENREAFSAAVAASESRDADKLRGVIGDAGLIPFCRFICFFFCSWRCVLVCLTFCREFPLQAIDQPVREAFAFAREIAALAKTPAELERLSAAVGAGDAKTFVALVRELKLERFCIQLCHWLCFVRCRRFCILVCPEPDTIPLFTHVGVYHVDPIYGDFQADGTTTAGGFAFTRTIPLIGILPGWEALNTYEYRFRIAQYPSLSPVQDVVGAMIKPTVIGELEFRYWDPSLPGPDKWTTGSTEYYANNPGATHAIPQQFGPALVVPVNTAVQAGGWIKVPHENNLTNGGGGRFIPNTGRLVDLDTTQFTDESSDLSTPAPGLKAGVPVPAGVPPHSEKPTYKIFFEARKVMGPVVSANNLEKIAFSNTAYTYVRHAEWDGGPVTTRSVCSLDIAEMVAPGASGCDKQHNHVHALYTCYHPYLGSVLLWLQGPGIPTGVGIPPSPVPPAPFSFAPAVATDEAVSGPAGHDFDLSGLRPCAYILWCSSTVKLTEGWGSIPDATDWDVIAFCKGG
jgi:hypothetical protein